jgi:hypothetical protein
MRGELELYSGLRFLGLVRPRGDRWDALGDDFRPLGTFPNQKDAEDAVIAVAVAIDDRGRG